MDDKMTDSKPTLRDIYEAVDGLRNDIATNYVTKDAFEPVRNIVYGLVAVFMIAVCGAIATLVIHTSSHAAPTTTVQVKPEVKQ